MKKIYLLIVFMLFSLTAISQSPARHPNGVTIGDPIGTSSDPASLEKPTGATIYWNTTLGKFRKWNGTIWSDLIVAAGAGSIYETELTNGQNNINVGFTLESTTLVYFNGKLIPNALWSGEGTAVLNVSLDTKLYDQLSVKN